MSKRKSNKKVKQVFKRVASSVLDAEGKLGHGSHKLYLDYCYYDGMLKVFNHWECPYPIIEGVVSEVGYGFELGVASITADQLKGIE